LGQLGVHARSGIVVPLIFRAQAYGVLLAIDRLEEGPAFTSKDEMLLSSFAVSAAIAVATAQSVTAERHRQRLAAAEAERRRWARELHDDTLQSLSALRIGLSAARRSPEGLVQAVGGAIEQLEEAISNLRTLITDLRPAALDELGVKAAVEALSERSTRSDIQVDVSIELDYERGAHPTRLTAELETAIYRIIQEALTNAIKHGHGKRAVIEIHERRNVVELMIRDDGRGFDTEAQTEGFGLLGMRERVALLGGELQIRSSAAGTIVTVRLPAMHRESKPAIAQQAADHRLSAAGP
jgi:signal transduction histidine kinase